jgi:hypothetical protein
MTLETALKKLLQKYVNWTRQAEENGDDALAVVYQSRRDQISGLIGWSKTQSDARSARLWRECGASPTSRHG